MGWEDYHLYEFRIGRDIAYGVPDPNWDFPGSSARPANKTTLAELLAQTRNKTFKYVYDFGDDWRHTVPPRAHADMVDWRSPDFDPDTVDQAGIQKKLNRLAPRRKTKTAARR